MEKKKIKALEKETEEKMMMGEGIKHTTWRDEMDSGGDEEELGRDRERREKFKTSRTSRLYRYSKSASPDSVSCFKIHFPLFMYGGFFFLLLLFCFFVFVLDRIWNQGLPRNGRR